MRLEDIGFYTLSDDRALNASPTSPLWRCELLVTYRCNFACPYCRGTPMDAEITERQALRVLGFWRDEGLRNVRFSGGEPTLVPWLPDICEVACRGGARVAISTNGSAERHVYEKLLRAGVTDFSVSLDACCAATGEKMSGKPDQWERVVDSIRFLAARTYVTAGVVVTEQTVDDLPAVVTFAHDLGVADIRIISAAQWNGRLLRESLSPEVLVAHPILRYRVERQLRGEPVRGMGDSDTGRCWLAMDDMVVRGDYHYPCVIHMREGGRAIGRVGPRMRDERIDWLMEHRCKEDQICSRNCLDVCVAHNNVVELAMNQLANGW